MKRHFTATGFVVDGSRTLLHWHKRLQQWMPPGGHIEADEDPVQAVLREIEEETGLLAEVISLREAAPFEYPQQLPPPYTILIEDIPGPGLGPPEERHKHIDMIYFCRVSNGTARRPVDDPTLRWVGEEELRDALPLDVAGCGISVAVPEDVRELALLAIDVERRAGRR
ncbi:MAG TPA: NUDIX domain-containing protein [Dehalococcoidia bacterium]|nr:NUDIX domain-containing protein [Dehalococcoidia bacterium]